MVVDTKIRVLLSELKLKETYFKAIGIIKQFKLKIKVESLFDNTGYEYKTKKVRGAKR
tara:strand:+ start:1465 stop:1638 length:174 start_codon:yes stop_codon:yes gene_type:complete